MHFGKLNVDFIPSCIFNRRKFFTSSFMIISSPSLFFFKQRFLFFDCFSLSFSCFFSWWERGDRAVTQVTERLSHEKLSSIYPRNLRLSLKVAVQLPYNVLSFGPELRPSKKKAYLVFCETERVSRERTVSWPTKEQQKPELWRGKVRVARGH